MSPPIRDGSGNSIGSIRLGDGSEISEVRTGAGDVVFSAIHDNIVEDFEEQFYEDQNLSLSDRYSGNTADFQRQTSTVEQGTHALEGTGAPSNNGINTTDFTFGRGETVRWNVRFTAGDQDSYLLAAVQQQQNQPFPDDCYQLQVQTRKSQIAISKQSGGSGNPLTTTSVTIPQNSWLEVEFDFGSPTLTLSLFDSSGSQIAQTSADDSEHDSGGIGWFQFDSSSESSHYWDHLRTV